MRNKWLLLPLTLAIPAHLFAQAGQTASIELWNGFTTASSKAEIKAFKANKPKHRVEVYPGCLAEMTYRHIDGKLASIIFLGQDREANCFARMYADLLRDRGNPETKGTTFGSVIGFGSNGNSLSTMSAGSMLIWREGEKKVKLVRTPGAGYNLIYTVRPDKYLY